MSKLFPNKQTPEHLDSGGGGDDGGGGGDAGSEDEADEQNLIVLEDNSEVQNGSKGAELTPSDLSSDPPSLL